MKQENHQTTLDEVINDYLLARAEMTDADGAEMEAHTLAGFAARYPQHARALLEFSANFAAMEELSLPESNESTSLSARGEESRESKTRTSRSRTEAAVARCTSLSRDFS